MINFWQDLFLTPQLTKSLCCPLYYQLTKSLRCPLYYHLTLQNVPLYCCHLAMNKDFFFSQTHSKEHNKTQNTETVSRMTKQINSKQLLVHNFLPIIYTPTFDKKNWQRNRIVIVILYVVKIPDQFEVPTCLLREREGVCARRRFRVRLGRAREGSCWSPLVPVPGNRSACT